MSKFTTSAKKATLVALTMATVLTLLIAAACTSEEAQPNQTEEALVEEVNRLSTEVASIQKEVEDPTFSITLWQGQDILGKEKVTLESLLGQKPLILNLWSAESRISETELPEFQSFYENHRNRVTVLAVNVSQTAPGQGKKVLAELGVTFPAGYTKYPYALSQYGANGLPTTIFFNADGSVHTKWSGALTAEVLKQKTEEMLKNSQTGLSDIDTRNDCDQLLRNQIKFQRGASTEGRMNEVIRQIQNQRDSCMAELWNPLIRTLSTTPQPHTWTRAPRKGALPTPTRPQEHPRVWETLQYPPASVKATT